MKVSHVLYKVNDLNAAVEEYRKKGFVVEYGVSKNPYNAVIYFSSGPYLELFSSSGMSRLLKIILRAFGKGKMADRMNTWENSGEGLIGVAIENYGEDFTEEKRILKKYHQNHYFEIKNKRLDTKGRLLKFRVLFPNEMKVPFFMTYFKPNPKPQNFIHPNGVKSIKSISFGTSEKLIPLIHELCDDKILKLFVGEGVKDLEYEK